MVHMVCRTSQLAQNCLYLGLNTKKKNLCKEQFLRKSPSAALVRQTHTKVLTAHREIDRRGILKCSNTEPFF